MMENFGKREGLMRLYNIYYLCKQHLPVIKKISLVDYEDGFFKGKEVTGWREGRDSLLALKKLPCFAQRVEEIFKFFRYSGESDAPMLSLELYGDFKYCLDRLVVAVTTVVELCESVETNDGAAGIDVLIPRCESLAEYRYYLREIDFVFTQCPYLLHDQETIKFKSVDVGSQWITFAVVGATAAFYILNNLATIARKVAALSSDVVGLKRHLELLNADKLKNKILADSAELFEVVKNEAIQKTLAELKGELGELKDGEEYSKAEKSIAKLLDLSMKGVKLYSSIEAPKDIKARFPFDEDTVLLPANVIEKIEEKCGKIDETDATDNGQSE